MKKINSLLNEQDDLPFNTNINSKELYDTLSFLNSYNFKIIKPKLEQYIKFHKHLNENVYNINKYIYEKKYNKMFKNLILYNNIING